MLYEDVKRNCYNLLHPEINHTRWDKALNAFIIGLIVLNVAAVMLETVPSIYTPHQQLFYYFDTVSIIIFSLEFLLRLWTCNLDPKYRHPVRGRLKYLGSFAALIDLLAILPFFLHVLFLFDLRVLRIFRLLRFLRLFRLTAYMNSTRLLINVFKSTRHELMLSLILTLFLIVISSCLIYFCEHPVQPERFTSIPGTMWWSVITLTTVGYGDMYPITNLGRILTSIILLAGVALLALPAGIITAGFLDEIRRLRSMNKVFRCPHCGGELPDNAHHH
jgi:voltage-gated potassium channel